MSDFVIYVTAVGACRLHGMHAVLSLPEYYYYYTVTTGHSTLYYYY